MLGSQVEAGKDALGAGQVDGSGELVERSFGMDDV